MISKKAQGGPGLGTIIAVGVMLVAAILIILYFLDVFNTIGDLTKISPSALSAKAEICKGLGSSQVAYCEFTEVEKSKYINCAYGGDANFKKAIEDSITNPPTCLDNSVNFCDTLKSKAGFKGVSINGVQYDATCIVPGSGGPTG